MAAVRGDTRGGAAKAAGGAPAKSTLRPDQIGPLTPEWTALYEAAAEKNPFFAPWSLIPALQCLAADDVRIACARDQNGALIGLAPMIARNIYAHLPLRFVEIWRHEHAYYGAPLLRRGVEQEAALALVHIAESMPQSPAFLRLTDIDGAGPAAAAFSDLPRRLAYATDMRDRPLRRVGAVDALAHLSSKRRSELRRRRARLAERGGLIMKRLTAAEDIPQWTEEFLALERCGWKGGAGTALADCARAARYFRAAVAGAFEAGALHFVKLEAGGAIVAMAANFLSEGEGYGFKICIDESYARYSPGMLLVAEIDAAFAADSQFRLFDSCAGRDQSWVEGLWPDRRRIIGLNVSLRGASGATQLRAARFVEDGARLLRPSFWRPRRAPARPRSQRHAD